MSKSIREFFEQEDPRASAHKQEHEHRHEQSRKEARVFVPRDRKGED